MVFSDHNIVFLWVPREVMVAPGKWEWRWLTRVMKSQTRWSTEYFTLGFWYKKA